MCSYSSAMASVATVLKPPSEGVACVLCHFFLTVTSPVECADKMLGFTGRLLPIKGGSVRNLMVICKLRDFKDRL